MIPWFEIKFPSVTLPVVGAVTVHAFGILVALGILVGARRTRVRAGELGLDANSVGSMISTVVVTGFVVAHLFDVVAYAPGRSQPTLWTILNPFNGISSFGGFAGALLGLFVWARRHRQPMMPYADALAFGLAYGWLFGRLGCFTAHDHPGRLTRFVLAVRFPDGPRHDLGFEEAIWALAIVVLFSVLHRKRRPLGTYVTVLSLAYAPVRFALDFLRATDLPGADTRYLGLTPAQYGCLLLFAVGIALVRWMRLSK